MTGHIFNNFSIQTLFFYKFSDAFSYVNCSYKKIDEYKRVVVMNECTIVTIDDIINIDGEIF